MVARAFADIVYALCVTIILEIAVAALFGLRGRALGAVASVNLVTNPLLSAFVSTLYALGVGYTYVSVPGKDDYVQTAPWMWAVLSLLEVIIVVVEWRVLVWALAGSAGSSRKFLALAIVMNAVSATLGTLLLNFVLTS